MSGIEREQGNREHTRPAASAVEAMIRELASALPDGVAELSVQSDPSLGSGGRMLVLSPSNSSAARIHVDVSDELGFVSVSLGRGALFEVPVEGHRYSDLDSLDEVRALCLAAVRGHLVETVRFKGSEVVGASATARIGSAEVGDSWHKVFVNPFRRGQKKTFTYEPYDRSSRQD